MFTNVEVVFAHFLVEADINVLVLVRSDQLPEVDSTESNMIWTFA